MLEETSTKSDRRWLLTYAGGVLMVASILLGGGTRPGFLSDVILQLLSIPVLLLALGSLSWRALSAPAQFVVALALAWIAIPLFQLVPLPIGLWARAGGREVAMHALSLAEVVPTAFPLSVAPMSTWQAVMSLLPPLAMLLVVVQLQRPQRRKIAVIFLVLAVASGLLGLLQLAQGPLSPLRFFAITNEGDAVGFFANRNHFAALAYAAIPIALAVLSGHSPEGPSGRRPVRSASMTGRASPTWVVAMSLAVFILVAAQAMARSRAGLGLAILSLAGASMVLALDHAKPMKSMATRVMLGAVAVSLVLAVQFATLRITERFTADPLGDARITYARNTWIAAIEHLPFGSGFGTFPVVYPRFPSTQDEFADIFANRAHNDVLEAFLEGGIPVAIVVLTALIVFLIQTWRIWAPANPTQSSLDIPLSRAGSLIVGLLAAHSFADYPLRTSAIAAVFVLGIGLMLPSGAAPMTRKQDRPNVTRSPASVMSESQASITGRLT